MKIFENAVITKVHPPLTVSLKKGQTATTKNRNYHSIVFCLEGDLTYNSKDINYYLNPQSAVFLPKNSSYSIYSNTNGVFLLFSFDCENLNLDSLLNLSFADQKPYLEDYKRMSNYFLFDNKKLKRFRLLYDIFDRLDSEQFENRLSPIIKYIEKNLSDTTLNNQRIANIIGISDVHFRKIFSEEIGIPPKQYILDLRLKKAKLLLAEGDLTVTKISEECGFSSPYHFCRIFKQKTGITPLEYSKNNRIYRI